MAALHSFLTVFFLSMVTFTGCSNGKVWEIDYEGTGEDGQNRIILRLRMFFRPYNYNDTDILLRFDFINPPFVNMVFCDTFSDSLLNVDCRNGVQATRVCEVKLPATSNVLFNILSQQPIACAVFTQEQLIEFAVKYDFDGGQILQHEIPDSDFKPLHNIREKAPHLFTTLIIILSVIFALILLIIIILVIRGARGYYRRKNEHKWE